MYNNDWIIRYDYFSKLLLYFVMCLVGAIFCTAYGAQRLYDGYYILEGVAFLSVGILCFFGTVLLVFAAVSCRTVFTKKGITRKAFSVITHNIDWKEIRQVSLVTKGKKDYFYFSKDKMPAEIMIMSRAAKNVIVSEADEQLKSIVLRYYHWSIPHHYTNRVLAQKPKKIKGMAYFKLLRANNVLLNTLFFGFILLFVCAVALFSFGLIQAYIFYAILFALLVATFMIVPLGLTIFIFTENGIYSKRHFVNCSINKFEIKTYGVYTDKDCYGIPTKKYIFVSKLKLQGYQAQYYITTKNRCTKGFLYFEYNDEVFNFIKDITVLEPMRISKQYY